jgi:heme-degrading monooxygenase HmoA
MIDRGITYVRDELMPEITRVEGCVGLSLLVDRASGRCIATSAWETEAAMRASEDDVRPLRDRFIATVGGTSPEVDEWEVSLMHRAHPSPQGAGARTSWLRGDPTRVDSSVEAFRSLLPTLEGLPGFSSASLLIDRASGRAVSTIVYDSANALAQTRERANGLRMRLAEQTGTEIVEVAEFELALAHLRVPEMV